MSTPNPPNDLGLLESLLADEHVVEIMINGPESIYVERHGTLEEVDDHFESEEHLLQIINRIVTPLGVVVNEASPICDARLPDGSRMNVVLRPIAVDGPTVTIRKLMRRPLTLENLITFGSLSEEIAEFLHACVLARLNLMVAGGTGSGKTTVFNILANFISPAERIVVVENYTELQLKQKHVVTLETRLANAEGKGAITAEDLVINAMKMRPDRLLLSEARGPEVLHFFQAMNTGHDGSMFTMHATSTRDALARLEIMATMAAPDLPLLMIREQMGEALDLIVLQQRLQGGSRKIVSITEVLGMKGSEIMMQDIFEFVPTGVEDGRIIGYFTPTGNIPTFINRIEAAGVKLSNGIFTPKS